jgi:hypothetical protein
VRVRLVTRGSFFLEHALAADAALAVDVSHATDVDGAARDRHDMGVLICDGCRALPDARAGVLWIPPADGARPPSLEALTLADPDHPIARGLEVTGLSGAVLPRPSNAPAEDVIVRAGNAPAVVAYDHAGRRVVELNLDLASSTLPLDIAFPVFLAHAIDWLGERGENATMIVAGEPLHWSRGDLPVAAAVTVTGPDGRSMPTGASDREIVVTDTSAAGIYHVRAAGTDRVFVVNPATATESDLSAPSAPAVPASSPAPGGSTAGRVEFPALLLVAALLMLAVEWRQRCRGAK